MALACSTCRPICITDAGRRASAFLMRFCTSTWASAGAVPGAKVAVISARPVEPLEESKYSSPLVPLSSSSMTLVTDSITVVAEAPG